MSSTSTSQPYVFDQNTFDHERLIRLSRTFDHLAREAGARAGLRAGARAIDVGCGPLGALPVLAELVGPGGTIVGIDGDEAALAQAQVTLDRLGVRGVQLVHADVNALDHMTALRPGSFDLAYCRFLLMYQRDPAASLRQIARLVRSGGRIVAIDGLNDPNYPRVHPPVPALGRVVPLFLALVERKGGCPSVARRYREICARADVRLVEQRGFFLANDPRELLAWWRDVLLSMRGSLVAQGLAQDEEIDALVQEMDAAQKTVEFGAAMLMVEMIAEVP
jgi:ubiquinone/menaquinone biosynthesis C-methylase UbiE